MRYSSDLNSLELSTIKRQRLREQKFPASDVRYQGKLVRILDKMPDNYVITYNRKNRHYRYIVPRNDEYLNVVGSVLNRSFNDIDWNYSGEEDEDPYRLDDNMESELKRRLAFVLLNRKVPKVVTNILRLHLHQCETANCKDPLHDVSSEMYLDEANALVEAQNAWEKYLTPDFSLMKTHGNIEYVHVK